jgi:protein-S-isoprenylcysteine O-methyltransferase Ste14
MLPLASLVVFFAVALVGRALLQRRIAGNSGIALFGSRGDVLHDALFVALPGVLIFEAARAAVVDRPALTGGGFGVAALTAGLLLMAGGLAIIVLAQVQMGASWRVGIDRAARPGLVTRGLFARSRNPIYLGLIVALIGFAALLPTALVAAAVLAACLAIRVQIGREEQFLAQLYGADFEAYRGRVGRFWSIGGNPAVPLVGRSPTSLLSLRRDSAPSRPGGFDRVSAVRR